MGENTKIAWAAIPGFPGYRISRDGRILGKRMKILRPWGVERPIVILYKKGTAKAVQVSRMMLLTWVGPAPKGKPYALHTDDDTSNNRIANLRWGSQSENKEDERKNRGRVSARKCSLAKVTDERLFNGSARSVARAFGTAHTTVLNERRRRNGN